MHLFFCGVFLYAQEILQIAGKANLQHAQKAKQDEFYTQLTDIEKELRHYKNHFKGKTVFCNCDDPFESNFFKYFAINFNFLGLKKLIATCYDGSPIAGNELPLFEIENSQTEKKAYKIEITEVTDENGDGAIDLADVELLIKNHKNTLTTLNGNGDFRSDECIELLKQADIVVTNPPFSLFREYVIQLIEYKKQFVILGPQNSITYKEIFAYLKNNQMWLSHSLSYIAFKVPTHYEEKSTRFWIDKNNQKWRSFGNICWFTNLDIPKRHEMLDLYKRYKAEEYPEYGNYKAINVDKVTDIPYDYDGVMGVPITFLDKHNPEQFEIVALGNSRDNFTPNKDYINPKKILKDGKIVTGGAINCVLAIELEEKPQGVIYYISDNSKYLVAPFARILIRRKGAVTNEN